MTASGRAWCLLVAVLAVLWPALAGATEIVVWHAWRGAEETALRQVGDAYEAETGVQVRTVAVPFGAFDSKLETAIPRGNGPDVFLAAHGSLGKWATMGIVQPVEVDPEPWRPGLLDALSWEGRTWGLPVAFKSLVLLYDPAVIERPPETTDALLALARAHTGGGRYGLAYQASEPYFHAAWAHAFGAFSLDEAGEVHLDDEAHVRALAFSRRLAVEEGVVPPQPTGENVSRLYEDGNAAFVISGPWFVADTRRPIAAAPLPVVSETGRPAQPYLTVDAGFLATGAAHPEEAERFLAYLAGEEGARIRQDVGRQAVALASVTSDDPLLSVLIAQAERAVPMPVDPDVLNVWEAEARALRKVLRGSASPEQAAAEAQTYYTILARPPPAPANPLPYLALLGVVAVGGAGYRLAPLRDAAERSRIRRHARDYLWVLPATVAMLLLVVLPFVTGATVSLFAHHRGEWSFVGLQHFLDILLARDWPITSPLSFGFTLGVTVLWTVANVVLHVGIGIALALVLREPWIRMRPVWRALLILPWAVPNYITALVWKGMFHVQFGAINAILGAILPGDEPVAIDWFSSFTRAFGANLATNTWLGFPFMMVVTLGALQSIPRDLEEAAEIDGASYLMRFRHVVWPLLRPALLPAVILGSVWTFNMFNVIYLVSAGEPDGSTEILISEAYRWAFSRGNRYGYASAYAMLIFLVLLVYSRGANRLVGRRVL